MLHSAFDQIVGKGRWRPRDGLGTFPVRFPHPDDPGDAGWHVDLSFPGEDCDPSEQRDFSSWRVNVTSRGRALPARLAPSICVIPCLSMPRSGTAARRHDSWRNLRFTRPNRSGSFAKTATICRWRSRFGKPCRKTGTDSTSVQFGMHHHRCRSEMPSRVADALKVGASGRRRPLALLSEPLIQQAPSC